MGHHRKLVSLLSLAIPVLLVAAACGDDDDGGDASATTTEGAETTEAGDGAAGGDFIDLQGFSFGSPDHIDPALADTFDSAQVSTLLYDGLVEYDFSDPTSPVLTPLVAQDWTVNDDATEFVFTLRDDVTFSNGEEVLPSSFKRAWTRALTPALASSLAYHLLPIEGATELNEGTATELTGVVADDEARTLTITMAAPFADFPGVLTHTVFSPMPTEVDALADQTTWEQGVMIGNGPFIQPEPWEAERQIALARNETYFGGLTGEKAKLDTLTFVISADVESAYADFEAGNGNTGRIPPGRFEEAIGKYGNATEPNLAMYHFWFNQESQLGGEQNLKLRQAMSLAVDRKSINDTVYDGARLLPTGITMPGIPGYAGSEPSREAVEAGLCEFCGYDLERAKQLYGEWQAEGGSLAAPVTINFNSGSGHEEVVAIIEQNLQALGLQTKQDPRDPTNYFKEMREGACEFCRAGWIWDYPLYDNGLYPLVHSASIGGDNLGRLNDPSVDALIDEARSTADEDARIAKYVEAETAALATMTIVPINWYTGQVVYDDTVENLIMTPIQFILYDQITMKQS